MRVADVGQYPIGQYAAVVTFGSQVIMTPVTVTTICILSGSTGGTYAFWAVNLSDFSAHRERVRFTAFAKRQPPIGSSRTATDSPSRACRPFGAGNSTVIAQIPDGSVGVMSTYWYNPARGETAFVQTDRPLYREGQHVHFRAIYRAGEIGSFAPPHGKRRIRVLDDDNTKSSIAP